MPAFAIFSFHSIRLLILSFLPQCMPGLVHWPLGLGWGYGGGGWGGSDDCRGVWKVTWGLVSISSLSEHGAMTAGKRGKVQVSLFGYC